MLPTFPSLKLRPRVEKKTVERKPFVPGKNSLVYVETESHSSQKKCLNLPSQPKKICPKKRSPQSHVATKKKKTHN